MDDLTRNMDILGWRKSSLLYFIYVLYI